MKRKEILMLVCAFFLGFFANTIIKSSCMGKLYEGADFVDHRDQDVGCGNNVLHFHRNSRRQEHHHYEDDLEQFLEHIGCIITSNNSTIGPSN